MNFPGKAGVYHVSSFPISKYDMLKLIKNKLKLTVDITPDDDFKCDRSLDSTHFRRDFNYAPPTWDQMIEELAENYLLEKHS